MWLQWTNCIVQISLESLSSLNLIYEFDHMCVNTIPGQTLLPTQPGHGDVNGKSRSNYVHCQVNLSCQHCQENSNMVERDYSQQLR